MEDFGGPDQPISSSPLSDSLSDGSTLISETRPQSWFPWRSDGSSSRDEPWSSVRRPDGSSLSCDCGAYDDSSTSDAWSSDEDSAQDQSTSETIAYDTYPGSPQEISEDQETGGIRTNADHDYVRLRRPRKQRRPEKSATRFDPTFRGVVIKFKTKVDSRNRRSRLSIRSYFSCHRRTRNCRNHRHDLRQLQLSTGGESTTSSSESESDVIIERKASGRLGKLGKQCASCRTKKTPLWRDAEDGTPLCNACGIRYKKYRIRCSHCWYVPRKSSKSYPICTNCGERVQVTSHTRTKISTLMLMTKYGKFYKKQLL